MQMYEFSIAPDGDEVGQRLDKVITDRLASLSRVKVQQLIKEGHIMVDGKIGKSSTRLEGGESVAVEVTDEILTPDWNATTVAEEHPRDVIYEDEQMAA